MSKALYSLIFSRILEQVNGKLCLDDCDSFLSILDIPGFRNHRDNNSLDQFLFNFTNEKIRVFTNIRMWNSFQDRGYKEGLVTIQGSSTDNAVVELISSAKGIISVLDSETARAKKLALTQSEALNHLTDKMNDRFSKTPGFKLAKAVKKKNLVVATHFTITHYAEQSIEYDASNFVSENAEVLHPNLVALFRGSNDQVGSNSKFARSLFSDDVISTQVFDKNKDIVTSAQISNHPTRMPSTKKLKKNEDAEDKIQAIPTVFSKFRSSLDELCNALIDSETWMIICISPCVPGSKAKNSWNFAHVKNQVTFHGLASLSKYQSLFRFPVAYRFPEFIEKFKQFFRTAENDATTVMDPREVCQMFSAEFEWGPREVALGSSEIFLSYSNWNRLHDRLERPKKELKIRPMFQEG
jgi:chitin synthase